VSRETIERLGAEDKWVARRHVRVRQRPFLLKKAWGYRPRKEYRRCQLVAEDMQMVKQGSGWNHRRHEDVGAGSLLWGLLIREESETKNSETG
jgi:hypothetical protein